MKNVLFTSKIQRHKFHLSVTSIMKLMARKVKGREIGEHILWPFFIFKQVCSAPRNSWCNLRRIFFFFWFVDKSVEETICQMYSCLLNYTPTTYYSYPAMKTIVGHLTRILKSGSESQFCLPLVSFACEPFQLINLKKCISHSGLESAFLKLCFQCALAPLN